MTINMTIWAVLLQNNIILNKLIRRMRITNDNKLVYCNRLRMYFILSILLHICVFLHYLIKNKFSLRIYIL